MANINTTYSDQNGRKDTMLNHKNKIRHRLIPVVICLNIALVVDAYFFVDPYIEDLLKASLSVVGVHLIIERVLEHHIYSLKPEDKILYSTTACIRDILNNIFMTVFYMLNTYAYWWRPTMWGCYFADLVMLISRWHYFKPSWRQFVFAHHFGVCIMLFTLNHTTKILTDPALVCLIIFMNSNTPGCASPIWKAFKLPFYERSSVICFVLQRAVRLGAYGAALDVDPQHFFKKDYLYIVLVSFALLLDILDIKSQLSSIYRYHRKQKLEDTVKNLPQ
eukprot:265369_1